VISGEAREKFGIKKGDNLILDRVKITIDLFTQDMIPEFGSLANYMDISDFARFLPS
jgi:bifunctional DNA-binding transcriptional regulator/antitoxin component of YhaV-PrlF toxin-antitoxin module